ncbi:MAG: uracil-DNA glycosylase [Candidatus Scalindua rubra]|uniref:Type-4 uracil-DNA glycosylase n=1 Tax=Candidatus Scalindua brodae TaxID=237368 RepID=A0A0B0EG94_9BACT|nr:MAG: putative phage protein [Candidatus Scalindua brodae]MBZ0109187.1 uracil-DNA glycosylase [Candidatus Scalindua rubra]TWU28966.1 Uracil DNA glycosylase superfamily protein [Candidatus Brocadiaceae bacterium S225]
MGASRQQSKLQEAKAELVSLLKVLSDKVDLERKLGVNYLQFDSVIKNTISYEENVISQLPTPEPVFDNVYNYNEVDKVEFSKSEKIAELNKLEEQVKRCTKCDLCKNRTNVVFGVGDPDADLMFVGEAPGYYEDEQGEPFVGKAGQLLTKIIESIGMKRGDVYIANILKCRPPENRNPNANEIVMCSPHLIRQIEIIRPKIICALGTFAAQTLLNSTESIGNLRGKFFEYQGAKFLATYHPAYLLRNPDDKKKVWADIKKVRDFLKENSS